MLDFKYPTRTRPDCHFSQCFYGWVVISANKTAGIVNENEVPRNRVTQSVLQLVNNRSLDPTFCRKCLRIMRIKPKQAGLCDVGKDVPQHLPAVTLNH